MTPLKTIIATAVIAVGGTVAAFSGLHIGQSNADAATGQAIKAKTTYSVTLTAKQLAKLMHGQNSGATHQARHHQRHAQRHAVRYQNNGSSSRSYSGSRSYNGSSGSYGSRSYSGHSGYRCYGNGGSRSGSWGGGSHSGGSWAAAVAGKTRSHRWEAGPRGSASQPWVQTKRERQRQQAKVKR